MQTTRITAREYARTFAPRHVFNSVDFALLNAPKADDVHFIAVGDSKTRFGIILGEIGERLLSPFSAPFGGFDTLGTQRLEYMEEAVGLVAAYAAGLSRRLVITMPPPIYGETEISKWEHAMLRRLSVRHVDLNYHFDLSRTDDYGQHLERSARKNLSRAMRENFRFVTLDGSCRADVERAYAVIRANRAERGFPLRMTLEQVWQTVSQAVRADFFVVEHCGHDVAAAQVFHVASGIGQVVYWGDLREYSQLRPMNFLTYSIFSHYRAAGFRLLDIGPSTDGGVPNYGLCSFKEGIGCSVTLKHSFSSAP